VAIPMTAQDRKWQAENDAHTLVEAAAIKSDKSRTSRAAAAAKKMAVEQQVRATAMKKVAKSPAKKRVVRKTPVRKK